jgi:hypothetical protein
MKSLTLKMRNEEAYVEIRTAIKFVTEPRHTHRSSPVHKMPGISVLTLSQATQANHRSFRFRGYDIR